MDSNKKNSEDSNSKLLAGLCYIPLFLIDVIVALYVLLVKKDDKYARFNAVQGLILVVVYFIAILIIEIPLMFIFSSTFFNFRAIGNSNSFFESWWQLMSKMMMFMIPIIIIQLLFLFFSLYLGYRAFTGKPVRIPVLASMAEKIGGVPLTVI